MGAVGGDAFHEGGCGQRSQSPRALQDSAVVIHIHSAVGIQHPQSCTGGIRRDTSSGGVGGIECVVFHGVAGRVVLVSAIDSGIIHDIELGVTDSGVIVDVDEGDVGGVQATVERIRRVGVSDDGGVGHVAIVNRVINSGDGYQLSHGPVGSIEEQHTRADGAFGGVTGADGDHHR